MITPSTTLAQPLLPARAEDAPPTWKLTLSLLWRSAKPRRAAEFVLSAAHSGVFVSSISTQPAVEIKPEPILLRACDAQAAGSS